MQEARKDNVVTGEYSYVDPVGALITVTYIADENGYREERKSQANFVQIRAQPVVRVVEPAPRPAPVRRVVRIATRSAHAIVSVIAIVIAIVGLRRHVRARRRMNVLHLAPNQGRRSSAVRRMNACPRSR